MQTYLASAEYANSRAKLGNWISGEQEPRHRQRGAGRSTSSPCRSCRTDDRGLPVRRLGPDARRGRRRDVLEGHDRLDQRQGHQGTRLLEGSIEEQPGPSEPAGGPVRTRAGPPASRVAPPEGRFPMDYRLRRAAPKLLMLLYGLIAFVVVVGGLLLLLDVVPTWFARRREAALVAASTAGGLRHRRRGRARRRRRGRGCSGSSSCCRRCCCSPSAWSYPAIRTILLSFKDDTSGNLVGLRQLQLDVRPGPTILPCCINTLIWVIVRAAGGHRVRPGLRRPGRQGPGSRRVAKSLIFMPMAISFVGASIIWKFVYAYRVGGAATRSVCSTRSWSGSAANRGSGCRTRRCNTLPADRHHGLDPGRLRHGGARPPRSRRSPPTSSRRPGSTASTPGRCSGGSRCRASGPRVVVVTSPSRSPRSRSSTSSGPSTNGNYDTSVIANEMYNQAFRYGQTGRVPRSRSSSSCW